MSCDITKGRLDLLCKDNISGVKNAYLVNYQPDVWTVANGEVTGVDVAVTEVFQFELRNDTNAFNETKGENGRESGVTLFEQEVVMALKKIDAETTDLVNMLAKGRPYVIVEDRNGNWRLAGLSEGCDATIEVSTGAAKGDFSGYTATFVAQEPNLAPHVDSSTVTALKALVVEPTPPSL